MCLERGQPLCPGRTCGLGVFTLALFQAVSHTACWRLSLLDDNALPSSHKRGILRLRWDQRSCWFTMLTNRSDSYVNTKQTDLQMSICVVFQETWLSSSNEVHEMIVLVQKKKKALKTTLYYILHNFLCVYMELWYSECAFAWIQQISRHLRHVLHRFSEYLTFSRVIQALGKHL